MESTAFSNFTDQDDGVQAVEGSVSTGRFVIRLLVRTLSFLFGVPGNCLVLRVYWAKTRKTSTHVLIMALACADLSVCLLEIHNIVRDVLSFSGEEANLVFDLILPFQYAFIATSAVITGVIAADRYDCVCRPQRRFFNHRRAKVAALTAFLFSVAISVPKFMNALPQLPSSTFFEILPYAVQLVSFVTLCITIVVCYGKVYATIRRHVRVGALLRPTTGEELFVVRPMPVVQDISAVDNILTSAVDQAHSSSNTRRTVSIKTTLRCTREVRSRHLQPDVRQSVGLSRETRTAQQTRCKHFSVMQGPPPVDESRDRGMEELQQAGNAPKRLGAAVLQRKTTKMLFLTSVVFLALWLPYWIYVAVEFAFYGGAPVATTVRKTLLDIQLVLFMNHAINPILYGAANRRFRKDCRGAFLGKMKLC